MSGSAIEINNQNDYELLFRQYYKGLCRYALNWLNDIAEAEEIVQNVFVKLWEKRQNIIMDISVKSYLYKAVYNASLNELKHQKVKSQFAIMQQQNEQVQQPLEQSSAKELQQKIEKAIQRLPEQCRLVFKMSRYEELKYREIASVLNISIKTVENQMGKALKLMRENLADYLTLLFIMITNL